jgi:hypothetical protein
MALKGKNLLQYLIPASSSPRNTVSSIERKDTTLRTVMLSRKKWRDFWHKDTSDNFFLKGSISGRGGR